MYWCKHPTHVSLPCCSNGRLLRLFYLHSALAATASGIGPRCSFSGLGCFQSSSIPGGLLRWPGHRHSHTSWRWYQGGHGCKCWTAMEPRQIPGGRRSWVCVACFAIHRWSLAESCCLRSAPQWIAPYVYLAASGGALGSILSATQCHRLRSDQLGQRQLSLWPQSSPQCPVLAE